MFCPRCGAKNDPPGRFCMNCAAVLPAHQTQPHGTPTPPVSAPPPSLTQDLPYPGYQGKQHAGFQREHRQPQQAQPQMQSYANSSFNPYATPVPYAQQNPSGRAIAALICMILSFVFCGPISAIPGLILARQELQAIQAGQAPPAGLIMSKISFYGSAVALVLMCGGLLLWFLFAGLGGIWTIIAN